MSAKQINWTTEQTAVFAAIADVDSGNLVVSARAGVGKTTTAKASFEHATERRILYVVFNKKNQKEAEAKITDRRVDVRTWHSLGFSQVKRLWHSAKPDPDVEWDKASSVLTGHGATEATVGSVVKLVSWLKNTTIYVPTQQEVFNIAQEQDCLPGDARLDEIIVCASIRVLELSKLKDAAGRISFDDMVWLPVVLNLVRPSYDLVCIDEAQDASLPQLTMAKLIARKRVMAVGDDRQAIYVFRGAMLNAMSVIQQMFSAKVLGLTVSQRNPRCVVRLAQQVVPDFKHAENAIEGEVLHINEAKALETAKPGDAILSRLNAPLMPLALSFLRRHIPARIEGRDIGKQMVCMVRSMKARTVPHFFERVEEWRAKQCERLMKARNSEKKLESVADIAQTLLAIAEGADTVQEVEQRIQNLFQDTDENSKPAVILSSVHKAKGLEWDNVFILSETFRRGKGIEEDNIYYVAITRAKQRLCIVGRGGEPASESRPATMEATTTPEPVKKVLKGPPPRREPSVPAVAAPPLTRDEIAAKMKADALRPDPLKLCAGMVHHRIGNVIKWGGAEFVCVRVSDCNAKFVCLSRQVVKIVSKLKENEDGTPKVGEITCAPKEVFLSNSIEPACILRRMAEAEVNEFLSRGARRDDGKTTQGTKVESENIMPKKKVSNGKITGAAEFVRELYNSGTNKTAAKEKLLAKFPKFEHDLAGFESRWNTAERITKNIKAKEQKAATSAKASGKKGGKAAKASGKKGKAAPPKRKGTPPPRASAPPPRATPAPTAAAAPAATPPPPAAAEPATGG